MPTNPFFNQQRHRTEQGLLDDLITEAIQIHGISTYYLARQTVSLDHLLGEDILSKYPTAREIEMYLKSSQMWGGQGEFVTKFGLQMEDQAVFVVSRPRFLTIFGKRPLEGDIIYVQMDDTHQNDYFFEIRFVEDIEQQFMLGRLYTYELKCELMVFSHERIDTNIPLIDDDSDGQAYAQEIHLGAGSGTFIHNETIYQGSSFLTATATGNVIGSTPTTVTVQDITGEFLDGIVVVGVTSGASYMVIEKPNQQPTLTDPFSDNETLDGDSGSVIVNRGNNPRISG